MWCGHLYLPNSNRAYYTNTSGAERSGNRVGWCSWYGVLGTLDPVTGNPPLFYCMVPNIRNNWVIAANQAQTDERRRPSQSRSESRSPLLTVPANSKHACMWGGLLAVVAGAVKTMEFTAPCRFSSVNPWHAMQVRARRHLRPGLWKLWSLQTPEESPL